MSRKDQILDRKQRHEEINQHLNFYQQPQNFDDGGRATDNRMSQIDKDMKERWQKTTAYLTMDMKKLSESGSEFSRSPSQQSGSPDASPDNNRGSQVEQTNNARPIIKKKIQTMNQKANEKIENKNLENVRRRLSRREEREYENKTRVDPIEMYKNFDYNR